MPLKSHVQRSQFRRDNTDPLDGTLARGDKACCKCMEPLSMSYVHGEFRQYFIDYDF